MSGIESQPSYADFDDYRHNQRVVVIVRWFMLGSWAIINHWNSEWNITLVFVDLIGLGLVGLNARLHFKLWRGERISRSSAITMSLFDVIAITGGIAITNGFQNTFFILYYPSLMGLALVTQSRRLSVLFVTLVAAAYSGVSIVLQPGLDTSEGDDRRLMARIMVMYALVIAANLINRAERAKRVEAVGAELARAAENLKLVTESQEEKLRVAEQRLRIRREIHDGLAQSLYAISLNIESTAAMAESSGASDIGDRLVKLIPVTRSALLETRHYMHDLSPMLSEEGDIFSAVENLASEFGNISDIEVDLQIANSGVTGSNNGNNELEVEPETATQICRIIQEALANVLKHSGATNVVLKLEHNSSALSVVVEDNGRGFDRDGTSSGFGLDHISSRAEELNGTCEVISGEGKGTSVLISIPLEKESNTK